MLFLSIITTREWKKTAITYQRQQDIGLISKRTQDIGLKYKRAVKEIHKKYTDLVPDIIEKYNGKILARGGNFKVLEGTDQFHRFVIIEFPSLEEGERCWSSKEYQKASSFRKNGSGVVDLILVESGDATK